MSDATILVASLVGTLVVFNTMLMSVNERTREVGILQTVGWHARTIVRLIVSEAMLLTLTGGALGCLLGMAAAVGMSHLDLMRGKIDAIFSPLFLAGVLALSAVLGIAGGLLPAIKASRMLPARALRHE
jgi:putative ABC transport system permease protein